MNEDDNHFKLTCLASESELWTLDRLEDSLRKMAHKVHTHQPDNARYGHPGAGNP